jgi:hypothetical protein
MLMRGLAAMLAILGGDARGQDRVPVIVELFTSEGCSSCPPADALLAQLQADQPVAGAEVIALALHVDYWDYIGWKDPFASPQFSERQDAYRRAFRLRGAYTPQMVVDGARQFVGSDEDAARTAIAAAAKARRAKVTLAPVSASAARLRVQVAGARARGADVAEVWVALTEGELATEVAHGENAGRRLRHSGVVRWLARAGEADAEGGFKGEVAAPVRAEWRRDAMRAVAFVQEREGRRVIGAAWAPLNR